MLKSLIAILSALVLWNSAIIEPLVPPQVPALIISQVTYNPPIRDKFCLAKAIYFEARNQTREGKVGVATVVLNRVHMWTKYKDTCAAVFDGCNFSWACSGLPKGAFDLRGIYEEEEWTHDLALAEVVLIQYNSDSFRDLTHGATYFHTAASGKPWWAFAKTIVYTVQLDDHIFYRKIV